MPVSSFVNAMHIPLRLPPIGVSSLNPAWYSSLLGTGAFRKFRLVNLAMNQMCFYRCTSPSPQAPALLQLLPSTKQSNAKIPDLNVAPLAETCRSKKSDLQVYIQRSPRLQKVYDEDRNNPVE